MFSVVIPIYNKEPHLARAVDSVLAQTYTGFELILVCDPSTDLSSRIAASFDDERIRIFHRAEPGPGGYAARNLGIRNARFPWIALLDADDWWHPENLERMADLIRRNPGAKIFSCARIIERRGIVARDRFARHIKATELEIPFVDYLRFSVRLEKPLDSGSIVVARSLTERAGLFPEGRVVRSGDLYTWVKWMAAAKALVWSEHVGPHIFKDGYGVTQSSRPSVAINIEMVEEIAGLCSQQELIWLHRYANRLIVTAWMAHRLDGGDVEAIWRYLYWKNDPLFSLSWSVTSRLPLRILLALRRLKRSAADLVLNASMSRQAKNNQ